MVVNASTSSRLAVGEGDRDRRSSPISPASSNRPAGEAGDSRLATTRFGP
jgi:hypothetical protein